MLLSSFLLPRQLLNSKLHLLPLPMVVAHPAMPRVAASMFDYIILTTRPRVLLYSDHRRILVCPYNRCSGMAGIIASTGVTIMPRYSMLKA